MSRSPVSISASSSTVVSMRSSHCSDIFNDTSFLTLSNTSTQFSSSYEEFPRSVLDSPGYDGTSSVRPNPMYSNRSDANDNSHLSSTSTQYDSNEDDILLNGRALEETCSTLQFDSDDEQNLVPVATSSPSQVYGRERERTIAPSTAAKRRRISQPIRDPLIVLRQQCCSDRCIDHLTKHDVTTSERKFKALGTETKQRQYILDTIREHSFTRLLPGDKVKIETNLVLMGRPVCPSAWRHVHNVTVERWKNGERQYRQGIQTIYYGNIGRSGSRDKTSRAIAWMRHLFERIGDYMPHKEEIHLPSCYTKKSLYERMTKELRDRGISESGIICYDYFIRIWSIHLPEFIISKRNEFVKCTDCTELEELVAKAKTDHERTRVRSLIKLHMEQVETERKRYHYHREKAEREPEEILTLIIDGMDQNKTNLPHLYKEDKSTSNLMRLRTHITGAIVHTGVTGGKIPIVYLDINHIPHDSNLTMNVLLEVLNECGDHLAKVLYVQLDNCFRENKNRYLLSLMQLLVQLDIFEEVYVNFLPVGHTHENVDQMFSKIATELRRTNAYTINDLETTVGASYTPVIKWRNLTEKPILNVKEWLIPHMAGNMRGHSKQHNFKFHKVDGRAYMQYRLWSTDPWEPSQSDENGKQLPGIQCLKSTPSLDEIPAYVLPSVEKMDLDSLRRDVPKGFGIRMPLAAVQWWNNFLHNVEDIMETPSQSQETWLLPRIHDKAKLKQATRQHHQNEELDSQVSKIREKLTRTCEEITVQGMRPAVHHVDNFECIKPGDMVAVYCPTYKEIPQIGQVTERSTNEFTLHWYQGSWTTAWKPSYHLQARKQMPYQDTQPIEAAIFWGFRLNGRKMLNKETRIVLKDKYDNVVANLAE